MTGATCRTCCRPIGSPYRRYDARGHVSEGCVAVDHAGLLTGESARWHNRPDARKVRKMARDALKRVRS